MIIVTYRSRATIRPLLESLRGEARELDLAVIVADNASGDDTPAVVRAVAPEAETLDTGGNLGYAGAINAACRLVDPGIPVLILNPDSVVEAGALRALLDRLADAGVGAVVPRLLDGAGRTSPSLRREPSILRALGDALVGSRMRRRPGALSETVWTPGDYERTHPVDWATGAAVLLSPGARRRVGEWDERFFLYSEETDYLRRVRDAGYRVLFEPSATVRHAAGGSGSSAELDALLAVNRIRYVRKHRSRPYAAAFRAVVVLSELLRMPLERHALALRYVVREARWTALPGPQRGPGPVT